MSVPEIYITTPIRNTGTAGNRTAATVRGQITQFRDFKLRVPRMGYRTADLSINLMSSELTPLYTDTNKFETYNNFLYVIWRGHVVFWGAITIKEVDFEGSQITLHAFDQGARLEHHYFRIGDNVLNRPGDVTKGDLPVGIFTLFNMLSAGEVPDDTGITSIPLAIGLGDFDEYTAPTGTTHYVTIERGQEVWRTMLDMSDRDDGPMFEFEPLPIDDPDKNFAQINLYGPINRDDISTTVKFHYNTGLNNVRNVKLDLGGEVITHAHVVSRDNHWRVTTLSTDAAEDSGTWIQWQQVDSDLPEGMTETDALGALGAIGDAILDQYARPLRSLEITLRRDDQIVDSANQFYWLDDFRVGDIIEAQAVRGPEAVFGKYTIDEVRLEQESDGSGQVRQAISVLPHVPVGFYDYIHLVDFVSDDEMS